MGLNAGLLTFDASGRIRCTTSVAAEALSDGSTPTYQGLLCCASGPPEDYLGGLGYNSYGQPNARPSLTIEDGGVISHYSHSAMPMTAAGNVAVAVGGTPHHWTAGIPYDVNGRVVLASPEVPALITGFSNGFSNGFGA